MQCPQCDRGNPDGARFCSHCGTELELRCPSCSTPHEPDANFCSTCGTALTGAAGAAPDPVPADDLSRYVPEELLRKIRAARAGQAMRGERRTVTMLFADIQGSTAAAEHLDPEEWAEIMNGAFGHLIEPVYRYEGTLARLQGDAILAFFGAPIAHEDDPVRATRAGLEIIEALGPYSELVEQRHGVPIGVRVGINTGLVVVGEVGSDLRVEYTALGDAINLAARMEQTADPGTVRVTEQTLQLLGGAFETVPIGAVEVKGKAEPVQAHQVVARLADVGVEPLVSGPLVGREVELAVLEGLAARLDDGIGGICTLSGEAGIGKSRLVAEMRDRIAARWGLASTAGAAGQVAWLRGGARSYELSTPHAAFVDLLSRWWELDSTPVERRADRIADAHERATGDRAPDVTAVLANLVGAAVEGEHQQWLEALPPPALHARTTEAVASYLAAEAHRRPMVLVLDDLHWADDLSLTLVERLMDVTEEAPLGLVLVMRPTRDGPSRRLVEVAVREHEHRHQPVDLEALTGDATMALLAARLGDVQLDDELRDAILDRANGNPLFVEELVRSLQDASLVAPGPGTHLRRSQVTLPPSLAGLLTARLDRLGDATRQVTQVASVIGREFGLMALRALTESPPDQLQDHLRELLRRGILIERRRVPDPAYAFRHPLIQETAYGTLLLRTRRTLHGRFAAHLAEHDPDAVHEIAHHLVEAGDTDAAFPYLVESGRRATRAMALRDAITAFTTALDAPPADADPELVMAAHDGLGQAYAIVPDLPQTAAAYQSLLDFGRQAGRPTIQVAALNRLGFNTAALSGDFDGAMSYLQEARDLAEQVGDEMGLAEYHMNACYITAFRGEVDRAVEHDEATARIGQQAGNEMLRLTALLRKTMNLIAAGRFDEARTSHEEAVEVAAEQHSEEILAVLDTNGAALFALVDGDVRRALQIFDGALPTIDRYDSYYGAAAHHAHVGCAGLAGDFESALSACAATERYGRTLGQTFAVGAGASGRARFLAMCGLDEDLDLLRAEAVATVDTVNGGYFAPTVWADLAEANLATGALEAAGQDVGRAASASGVNALWERPRIAFVEARLGLATRDLARTRRALDRVRELLASHVIRVHDPELFVLDGAVAAAEHRDADAVTLLEEAVAAASETGRVPIRIEALGRLAALRGRLGSADEARALRERAEADIDELANHIIDRTLRDRFRDTLRAQTAALAEQH